MMPRWRLGRILGGMGDKSSPTPLLSEFCDVETNNPLFYIPIRWTITVEQWGCNALHVANDAPAPKLGLCGNLTTKPALFRADHFFKKE